MAALFRNTGRPRGRFSGGTLKPLPLRLSVRAFSAGGEAPGKISAERVGAGRAESGGEGRNTRRRAGTAASKTEIARAFSHLLFHPSYAGNGGSAQRWLRQKKS
jgi:hypothetical protein